MSLITGRNEVVAKVLFLLVCVILFTRGGLPQCMLGYPSPNPPPSPREGDTPQEADPLGRRPTPSEGGTASPLANGQ